MTRAKITVLTSGIKYKKLHKEAYFLVVTKCASLDFSFTFESRGAFEKCVSSFVF